MNPYVSIDIETTGLDEETCQVLSVGAVIDDWEGPVDELPTFHCYVDHEVFTGSAFALSMHPKIFRSIALDDKKGPTVMHPDDVASEFDNWLSYHRIATHGKKLVVAGKNFGSFDHQFLKRLPNWKNMIRMKHRFIDPGNLYFDPTIDDGPPDTETCMARANILGEVAHTALEDAVMVVRLVRYWAACQT
jgi:DNA polymerase III epsilon subunit-like protein